MGFEFVHDCTCRILVYFYNTNYLQLSNQLGKINILCIASISYQNHHCITGYRYKSSWISYAALTYYNTKLWCFKQGPLGNWWNLNKINHPAAFTVSPSYSYICFSLKVCNIQLHCHWYWYKPLVTITTFTLVQLTIIVYNIKVLIARCDCVWDGFQQTVSRRTQA